MRMMYPQAHGRRGSLSSQLNSCHRLESVAHRSLTIYQLILEIYLMVPPRMPLLPLKPQPLRLLMAQMAGTWMTAQIPHLTMNIPPTACLTMHKTRHAHRQTGITYERPQDNPLLDSLADEINGIIFGLEEDKNMIHLRWSLLDSMRNAPDSIQAFQHMIICMLNTLLNENLFIPSTPSMIALHASWLLTTTFTATFWYLIAFINV